MNENIEQNKRDLYDEIHKKKDYINELFRLYNALKNATVDDKEWICKINSEREAAFHSLDMREIELLIKENENKSYYKFDKSIIELMLQYRPLEMLNEYRLMILFQYDEFELLNKQKFFDLLEHHNKHDELNFWIDYLLLFNLNDKEVIFRKSFIYYSRCRYEDAIASINKADKDSHLEELEINCLMKIHKFDAALDVIRSSKVMPEMKRHVIEISVIEEKNSVNKDCLEEFKKLYVEGINKYFKHGNINILSNSPYLQKYISKDAGEIYHYTDADGILGIVDNQQFCATKNDFLNDYKEHNLITNILEQVSCSLSDGVKIDDIKQSIARYFDYVANKEDIRKCNNTLDRFIDDDILKNYLNEEYIMAFSTDRDNLTLWGNYSQLAGYNIGFDREMLVSNIKKNNRRTKSYYNYIIEGKVIYLSDEEKANVVSNLINEIYSDFKKENVDDIVITKVIITHLILISNFIKHVAMSQEQEYRILLIKVSNESTLNSNEKLVKSKIRVCGNSLIPYIAVPIDTKASLKNITIGPTNNMDISPKGIIYLLRKRGLCECLSMVKKSNITLRY